MKRSTREIYERVYWILRYREHILKLSPLNHIQREMMISAIYSELESLADQNSIAFEQAQRSHTVHATLG